MTIADELNTQTETAEEAATETPAAETGKATETAQQTTAKAAETIAADKGDGDKATTDKGTVKTIAAGADSEQEAADKDKAAAEKAVDRATEIKAMREALAKHASAGDKKAYDKELKRIERLGIERPEQIYGLYRDLERWRDEGNLVKLPGKDARPEDVAAFHKALGVPEKPEDYLKDVKLENGAVIGEADKPVIGAFADAMHKAGAPPPVMKAALDWYYKRQEDAAAELDEADDVFRREAEKTLKEEMGPAFKRKTGAISSLFATAPGGADVKNENSLYARLVGGRTADGRIIGNDPDIMRWLIGMAGEINPAATVVEDGNQTGMSIDAEIEKIEKIMRTDRREYNEKHAGRYLELLEARDKIQARR